MSAVECLLLATAGLLPLEQCGCPDCLAADAEREDALSGRQREPVNPYPDLDRGALDYETE